MHGPTCIFWANLTAFSLQWLNVVFYLHGPADVPALAAFCQASAPADDADAA
jgi:hypothetical protein